MATAVAVLVASPRSRGAPYCSSAGSSSVRSAHRRSLSTIAELPSSDGVIDLPPITHLKSAISRQQISSGITYSLPVDKSRNSIEGEYRTNLRLMFKEPYVSESRRFDDERLGESKRHHLQPNSVASLMAPPTRYTGLADHVKLNMDSEKVRVSYSFSAPVGGLTGRETSEEDLRPRSTLFLPIKARVPPEAVRLKREAEKILQSVQEGDRLVDTPTSKDPDLGRKLRRISRHFSVFPELTLHTDRSEWSDMSTPGGKRASKYRSYAELRDHKHPHKKPLPDELKSPFMTEEKCVQIWDWLHDFETITDFSFFLDVCA